MFAEEMAGIDDSLILVADQAKLVGIEDKQLSRIIGNRVQIDPPVSSSFSPGGVGDQTFREWFRLLKPGGELEVSIARAKPEDVINALKRAGFTNVERMPRFTPPSSQWYSARRGSE